MRKQFNTRYMAKLLIIVLVLTAACLSIGCNGNSHVDEPEITVEYLQGEYAQQLVRDGAEVVFGTFDQPIVVCSTPATDSDESENAGYTQFTINAKEYVEDENVENGYYIADRNKAYIVCANAETRIAFDFANTGTFDIVSIDQLIEQDTNNKFFDFYLIDDQVLLILEHVI